MNEKITQCGIEYFFGKYVKNKEKNKRKADLPTPLIYFFILFFQFWPLTKKTIESEWKGNNFNHFNIATYCLSHFTKPYIVKEKNKTESLQRERILLGHNNICYPIKQSVFGSCVLYTRKKLFNCGQRLLLEDNFVCDV